MESKLTLRTEISTTWWYSQTMDSCAFPFVPFHIIYIKGFSFIPEILLSSKNTNKGKMINANIQYFLGV